MAEKILKKVPTYGPAVPPIGTLWTALRVAGESIEIDTLAGVSGAAFSTFVNDNCSVDVLQRQGRIACENVLPYMGYRQTFIVEDLSRKTKKLSESPDKIFERVRASIDAGVPVLVEGIRNWGIIIGYDDKGRFWLRDATPWSAIHDMGKCPPWDVGTEQKESWVEAKTLASEWGDGVDMFFIEKRGKGMPLSGATHAAIRKAVAHARDKGEGSLKKGLNALEFLASSLEREAREPQWNDFVYGVSLPAQVIFLTVNRACAVRFLQAAANEFSGETASAVQRATDIFKEANGEWLALQALLPNPQRYLESKETAKKYPEQRSAMVEHLRKIHEIETRAITELEGV